MRDLRGRTIKASGGFVAPAVLNVEYDGVLCLKTGNINIGCLGSEKVDEDSSHDKLSIFSFINTLPVC